MPLPRLSHAFRAPRIRLSPQASVKPDPGTTFHGTSLYRALRGSKLCTMRQCRTIIAMLRTPYVSGNNLETLVPFWVLAEVTTSGFSQLIIGAFVNDILGRERVNP